MKKIIFLLLLVQQLHACKRNTSNNNPVTPGTIKYTIVTNKAVYRPGELVSFTLNELPSGAFVRYRHLNTIIKEESINSTSWNWQPPADDYKGYLTEVFIKKNNTEQTLTAIAVDISSDWSKFPRYGFLSEFGQKTLSEMSDVINNLNRHHINGIQFYDWQDKHHQPLAGTVASPSVVWKDIANRDSYKSTVQGYIDLAHQKGMKAMFYNLCYGALSDAAADGVKDQWYMYRDKLHTQKDGYTLPKPLFKSDIFFTNPSNTSWQQYIADKNADVYNVYNFDGFHIDQVGNRDGILYDYDGKVIDLPNSFHSFISAMKNTDNQKKLVMNAVNQYGQQGSIATAPVEFLYTEVWSPNEGYKDLAKVLQDDLIYGNGKAAVLAAYINYNKAGNPGTFNTPGVLFANAVIFAFGGSHIELGEHMLAKEYFPNNNLQMDDELKNAMVAEYDFLTAYENLLRDGGTFNLVTVSCTNGKMSLSAWPPQSGKVAVQGKLIGTKQVMHFINFAKAANFEWRDTNGNQSPPDLITNADIEVTYLGTASKVWLASPDLNSGVPVNLSFTQTGSKLKFTLPALKYWDMIVIE